MIMSKNGVTSLDQSICFSINSNNLVSIIFHLRPGSRFGLRPCNVGKSSLFWSAKRAWYSFMLFTHRLTYLSGVSFLSPFIWRRLTKHRKWPHILIQSATSCECHIIMGKTTKLSYVNGIMNTSSLRTYFLKSYIYIYLCVCRYLVIISAYVRLWWKFITYSQLAFCLKIVVMWVVSVFVVVELLLTITPDASKRFYSCILLISVVFAK